MKAWIESLTPGDKAVALTLVARDCRFVWRNDLTGEPEVSPMKTETCWFEIWCSNELLSFVGPFRWPLPEGMVQTTGTFMIRQVESMMKPRHRS
ncbi:hypothetical protein [Deinococcus sp. UYEF24]